MLSGGVLPGGSVGGVCCALAKPAINIINVIVVPATRVILHALIFMAVPFAQGVGVLVWVSWDQSIKQRHRPPATTGETCRQ
jgi:hypothetical protein